MVQSTLPPKQTVATGFVVAVVGYFSSFAIVLQGLLNVGATNAQAASGLMITAIGMGVSAIVLSFWYKNPISVAWTTPGVAFLAISGQVQGGFNAAISAFLLAAALTIIAGMWRPLGRLAAAIPAPLTQAMLGGLLLSICTQPFQGVIAAPWIAVPIVVAWLVVGRFSRLFAVPAAVLAAVCVVALSPEFELPSELPWITQPIMVKPIFSLDALIGLGLPLFIITMATQNIPGIAILKAHNFTPPAGNLFSTVGVASLLSAPFGGPGICLAAITADMCANEDACTDRARRYWAAVVAGIFYAVFGVLAGVVTLIASLAPSYTIATLAGLALFGTFTNSTLAALQSTAYREAAGVTFLVTASGVSILNLGAAVSGLLAGGLVLAASHYLQRSDKNAAP